MPEGQDIVVEGVVWYFLIINRVPSRQGILIFLQGQGKVREFCKMVREIRKFLKVTEKSGNFKIVFVKPLKN